MRYGSVCSGIEAKACTACGEVKALTEYGRNRQGRNGLRAWCLACSRAASRRHYEVTRERRLAASIARREANPQRHSATRRAQKLRRQYGITPEEHAAMVEHQGGRCAICSEIKPLKIDHCHAGGHVRELLCGTCNTALGAFRDRPELLELAAAYLRRHAR